MISQSNFNLIFNIDEH